MAEPRRSSFERLEATLLACPKCRRAVQVRKRLLLILPEGDKYEYICPHCGSTVHKDTPARGLRSHPEPQLSRPVQPKRALSEQACTLHSNSQPFAGFQKEHAERG